MKKSLYIILFSNRYSIVFINLLIKFRSSKFNYRFRFLKIFTILASSNKVTSFLFGVPVLFFYLIFRNNIKVLDFLLKSALLHIPIRVLPCFLFYKIRESILTKIYKVKDQNHFNLSAQELISFNENGFLKLKIKVPSNVINNIHNNLYKTEGYSSQVPAQGVKDLVCNLSKSSRFVSHKLSDKTVKDCAIQLFESLKMSSFIKSFLGFHVFIYSINFYWGFPSTDVLHAVQKIHRDYDGYCCFALFIALSETSKDDSATLVIGRDGTMNYLEAYSGEVYLIDPFFKHSANSTVLKTRLTCWIRFGELPNLAFNQDLSFFPDDYDILKGFNN